MRTTIQFTIDVAHLRAGQFGAACPGGVISKMPAKRPLLPRVRSKGCRKRCPKGSIGRGELRDSVRVQALLAKDHAKVERAVQQSSQPTVHPGLLLTFYRQNFGGVKGIAMKFKAFLLDQWLQQHTDAEFDLGSSTGPRWSVRELLELTGDSNGAAQRMFDVLLHYAPTAGVATLREAIAEMQGVPAEEVAVFAGGAEALFHIFSGAAEPGANVIIPFPCFPAHEALPEVLGYEIRRYHLRRENLFAVDLDEVQRLADERTKILIVNSPHNPTGATLSNEEMRALHDFAAARGIQVVSDEVFHPIYHGPETDSVARLPHATVVGDLSKALSLGGLRLGWIVERDVGRRTEYLNAREHVTVSNTPMGEFLGEIAIRHHDQVLGRTREVTRTNLQLLERVVAQAADVVDWVRPMGGMTAWVRLVAGGDARRFCEEALHYGLLLAPGDCWGFPDHFRVGFGVGHEWYARAMERFIDVIHTRFGVARAKTGL
jgi:aspartate/methionine/tyrosine aminotransferase